MITLLEETDRRYEDAEEKEKCQRFNEGIQAHIYRSDESEENNFHLKEKNSPPRHSC